MCGMLPLRHRYHRYNKLFLRLRLLLLLLLLLLGQDLQQEVLQRVCRGSEVLSL